MTDPGNDLPKRLAQLGEEHEALLRRVADLERDLRASKAAEEQLQQFKHFMVSGQLLGFDYPVRPRVRFGHGAPAHSRLTALFEAHEDRYREHLSTFLSFAEPLSRIPPRAESETAPYWINGWIPALDAAAIYGFIAARNPRLYVEIGSGVSTKFARRAIRDHGLRTRIVSIDPSPRHEINALCDEVVRQPLEDVDQARLTALTSEDMLFFDGSHCCFQNSDATVFFTEILPETAPGLLIGVHDIFLPHDYPKSWLTRYYSEQYLLACYLLAGRGALAVELPAYYCTRKPELHGLLKPLWDAPALAGADPAGGALWFTMRASI